MKKFLLLSLLVLAGFGAAQAQTQVRVTVENQRIVGSNFYFDVMLQDTTGSPFYLGYADIVLTNVLPAGAFSSPSISYVTGSTTLLNANASTATGYTATTVNPALGAGANADRIIINVDFPAFANQTEFDARVARVDGSARRLGTFRVSANTKNAFVPNHNFHTTGAGIKTKIYEAAATTPWNQSRITSSNAFLLSSANVIGTAPTAAQFPSNFTETINSSTSITLNWTNGTHDGVILLYRLSNTATNSTISGLGADTTVANTLAYTANSNWSTASVQDTNKVGTSPYAVAFVGSGTSVTLTNLTAGEQYKYVLIPYNGVLGYSVAYASPTDLAANASSLTINRPSVLAAPTWTVAAISMFNTPTASSTSMDVNWYINDYANIATNDANYLANQDSILFVAIGAASASPTVAPALGSNKLPTVGKSYTPNGAFGSGDTLGSAPVARAVARVSATAASGTITFEGLTPETSYRIYAIPMRGNPNAVNAANYNLVAAVQQDVRFTTPTPVSAPAAGDLITSFNGAQNGAAGVNFTWTLPANSGYTGLIILAREAQATGATPSNGVVYTGNTDFSAAPALTNSKVVYSGSGTSANITGLNPNQRYHFTAIPYKGSVSDSNLAYTSDGPTNMWARSDRHTWMTVSLMANLEGAWNGTNMDTTLAIPANQPFDSTDFFNYNGSETYAMGTVPGAVDWVLVELRRIAVGGSVDTAHLSKVPGSGASVNVGRRAALLLNDGRIVDPANNQNILFQITQEGKYFAVIYHRNHIPIMTAAGVDTGKNIVSTGVGATGDLRTPANVLGTNADNYVQLSSSAFMAAGNAQKSNFVIDGTDRSNIWAARNQSNTSLYILEDVKFAGDDLGEVDATDRAIVWNNRNKQAAADITTP